MKIITLKITAAVKDGITPADVADAINLVADATAGFYACEIYGDETDDAPKAARPAKAKKTAAPAASEAKPNRKYTRRSKADSATVRQQTSGTTVTTLSNDGLTVTEMRK